MTNEEAIAIIRKEYLCVDRDCDIERSCGKCDLMMPTKEPILEAYKMAMQALEQEPKVGRWINDKCSICGKGIEDLIDSREWYKNETPNYCPFCGKRMVESEGEE